jgi:hypothetical protein
MERLAAAGEIDDRKPRLHEPDAAGDFLAHAVRPAMRESGGKVREPQRRRRWRIGARLHPGDAAHQRGLRRRRWARTLS